MEVESIEDRRKRWEKFSLPFAVLYNAAPTQLEFVVAADQQPSILFDSLIRIQTDRMDDFYRITRKEKLENGDIKVWVKLESWLKAIKQNEATKNG